MKIKIVHTCRANFASCPPSNLAQSITDRLSSLGRLPAEFSVTETGFAEIDGLIYQPDSKFSDPESIRRFDAIDLFVFSGTKPLEEPWNPRLAPVGLLMTQCVQFSRSVTAFGSAYVHLAFVLATGGQLYEWKLRPSAAPSTHLEAGELDCASGNTQVPGSTQANIGACRWDSKASIHHVDGPLFDNTILQHGSMDVMHNCLPNSPFMLGIDNQTLFKSSCRWTALGSTLLPRVPTLKVLARCSRTGVVALHAGRASAAQFVPDSLATASEMKFLENILRITCSQLSHLAGVGASGKNLLLAQNSNQGLRREKLHSTILPAPVTLANSSAALIHNRETEFDGPRLEAANTITEARQDSQRKAGGGAIDAVATDLAAAACISSATSNAQVLVFPAYAFRSVSMQQHPMLRSLHFNSKHGPSRTHQSDADLLSGELQSERLSASAHRARRAAAMLAASAAKHMSLKSRKEQNIRESSLIVGTGPGAYRVEDDILASLRHAQQQRQLPTALESTMQRTCRQADWIKPAATMATERLRTKAAECLQQRPAGSMDSQRILRQNFFRAKQTSTGQDEGVRSQIGNIGRGYELGNTVEPSAVMAMLRPAPRSGASSMQRVKAVGKLAGFGTANGAFDAGVGEVLSLATDASCTAECFSREHALLGPVFYTLGSSPPRREHTSIRQLPRSDDLGSGSATQEAVPVATRSRRLYSSVAEALSPAVPLRSLRHPPNACGPAVSVLSTALTQSTRKVPRPTHNHPPPSANGAGSPIAYTFGLVQDTPFTQSIRSQPTQPPVVTKQQVQPSVTEKKSRAPAECTVHTQQLPTQAGGESFNAYFKSSQFTMDSNYVAGGLHREPYAARKPSFREESRALWTEPARNSKSGFIFGATHTRSYRPGRTVTGYKLGDERRTYNPGRIENLPFQ